MKTSFLTVPAFALAAGLVASGPASAFIVTNVYVNNTSESVQTTSPEASTFDYGQIVLTTIDPTATIDAWCIDFYHSIQVGGPQSLTYSTDPFTDPNLTDGNGNLLTGQQKSEIAGLIANGNAGLQSGPNDAFSLATQLAIWIVEYNQNPSTSHTTFQYSGESSAVDTDVADLLTNLNTFSGIGVALISDGGLQGLADDQGNLIIGNIPVQAPEPASLALLGVGLAGLRLARRKRG